MLTELDDRVAIGGSMNRSVVLYLGCAVVLTACTSTETNDPLPSPRLILQITVDYLRGDLPGRYFDRFGDGEFRYLWETGVVYTDAYHNHAVHWNTEMCRILS